MSKALPPCRLVARTPFCSLLFSEHLVRGAGRRQVVTCGTRWSWQDHRYLSPPNQTSTGSHPSWNLFSPSPTFSSSIPLELRKSNTYRKQPLLLVPAFPPESGASHRLLSWPGSPLFFSVFSVSPTSSRNGIVIPQERTWTNPVQTTHLLVLGRPFGRPLAPIGIIGKSARRRGRGEVKFRATPVFGAFSDQCNNTRSLIDLSSGIAPYIPLFLSECIGTSEKGFE